MFVLGLTGPSGSGKSAAAKILNTMGFEIVDADSIAREVVKPGSGCLSDLCSAFGKEILQQDGNLDRKKLAKIAFFDTININKLNSITHPYIIRAIEDTIKGLKCNGIDYVVLDAPALFESGAQRLCDRVLAVAAPDEIRLNRIIKRDRLTPEEARLRLKAQPGLDFYKNQSDYVVENNGDMPELEEKVKAIALYITE